jgi:4-methyl-5(b-hydroxyethyl)-thiazole monophosphate biosynthesis
MTKIIVILATGFEEMEAIVPVDVWRRAGFEVQTASIRSEKIVIGSHNIPVIADTTVEEAEFETAHMIFLPGGMPGAKNLDNNQFLKNKLIEFNQKGKILGAICAAPLVLGHNNMLEGKTATCFPGFEHEMINAKVSSRSVETDKNIITGKGAGVALEFALTVVAYFENKSFANQLAKKMQVEI